MKIDQTKKIWQKKSVRYQKYSKRVCFAVTCYIVFYKLTIEPHDEIGKQTRQMPTMEGKAALFFAFKPQEWKQRVIDSLWGK